MYPAGTTLKIDYGLYIHYGIYDGLGKVIHNSKKYMKVVHEALVDFKDGKDIKVSSVTSENKEYAVIRAKRYIGMPYNLILNNCEPFAKLAHGMIKESTQVQQYFLFALGAGAAIKSDNTIIQYTGGAIAIASLLTPSEKSPFKNVIIAGLIGLGIAFLAENLGE